MNRTEQNRTARLLQLGYCFIGIYYTEYYLLNFNSVPGNDGDGVFLQSVSFAPCFPFLRVLKVLGDNLGGSFWILLPAPLYCLHRYTACTVILHSSLTLWMCGRGVVEKPWNQYSCLYIIQQCV